MGGIPDNFDELMRESLKEMRVARKAKERERAAIAHVQYHLIKTGYFETLAVKQKNVTLRVALKLNELCVLRRCNPVKLTSAELRKIGISRQQKFRALKNLERWGLVSVERTNGKNPLVTVFWK
jgi:hypothetical protein